MIAFGAADGPHHLHRDVYSWLASTKSATRITLGCSPYHTNSALFPVIAHLERVLRWQREDSADVKLPGGSVRLTPDRVHSRALRPLSQFTSA